MSFTWNEIRDRARLFAKEWAGETNEHAEAKSFWDAFFSVFGIPRRRVASFEAPATKSDGRGGFIDLLWKGVMLVEHKSAGLDLTRASKQALNYFPGIKDRDLPRYVVVSDFARIRLYDLEAESEEYNEFPLKDLHKHVTAFAFMLGLKPLKVKPENPVNQNAILRLSSLHDELERSGYRGTNLEFLLTRLVFCFFADDTGIFGKNQFKDWIESNTREDGSDTGSRLIELFGILNQPEDRRSTRLSEDLRSFRYVNGGLFQSNIAIPVFDKVLRESLLEACGLEWSQISPAIFGALFQGLMDRTERHKLGAHYTREQNIMRVIQPLFLDELRAQFESSKTSKAKLKALHERMRKMKFLDPAMGSGNFAVVSYRELRRLELEILRIYYNTDRQQMLPGELDQNVWINVDQFFGIEIDEKATHIARLALWLTDHQMNLEIGAEFASPAFARLPLVTSPTIVDGNALLMDWTEVLPPKSADGGEVFVMGNPPFLGAKNLNESQRSDANVVLDQVKGGGKLDFVAAWYVKAAAYIAGTATRCAFVSTNSIAQGDQVGILWSWLLEHGMHIQFAHRTFQWSNEARGQAQVHCVIIGFGVQDRPGKTIYEYASIKGEPNARPVANVNPYLVDGANVVCMSRTKPLCPSPSIGVGNKPIDGGFYLFTPAEKKGFLRDEPDAAPLFKRWLGSEEFINGKERWCLLVSGIPSSALRAMPKVMERIHAVQAFRRGTGPNSQGKMGKKRPAPSTVKLGDTPTLFHVTVRPTGSFLILPRHSSESRRYVPIGFGDPSMLVGDACLVTNEASKFDFGVLTSSMHNAWIRYTCGRIKSDFRLSARVVYNNFPWPSEVTRAQRASVESAANGVLQARALLAHAGQSLADMYDSATMDASLLKAHRDLDRAVDAAYSRKRFQNDRDRIHFLFEMYAKLLDKADDESNFYQEETEEIED